MREYDVIEQPDGSFAITCTIKFILIGGFRDRARAGAYIRKIQMEDVDRDPRPEGSEDTPQP